MLFLFHVFFLIPKGSTKNLGETPSNRTTPATVYHRPRNLWRSHETFATNEELWRCKSTITISYGGEVNSCNCDRCFFYLSKKRGEKHGEFGENDVFGDIFLNSPVWALFKFQVYLQYYKDTILAISVDIWLWNTWSKSFYLSINMPFQMYTCIALGSDILSTHTKPAFDPFKHQNLNVINFLLQFSEEIQ